MPPLTLEEFKALGTNKLILTPLLVHRDEKNTLVKDPKFLARENVAPKCSGVRHTCINKWILLRCLYTRIKKVVQSKLLTYRACKRTDCAATFVTFGPCGFILTLFLFFLCRKKSR